LAFPFELLLEIPALSLGFFESLLQEELVAP